MVAVRKQANAGHVPIHSKPCDSPRCPASAATLIPNSGTNTRKPHAADRPMPRQIERASSIQCYSANNERSLLDAAVELLLRRGRVPFFATLSTSRLPL